MEIDITGAIGGLASFKVASHVLRDSFLFKGSLWKCMITPAAVAIYNSLLQPGGMQYDPPVDLVVCFSVAISASLRA